MNTTTTPHAVSRWVIFMLALGAGFSVASIYYAQPLLPLMGADLHLSIEGMGLVPTLTQAGYALGILFLLPLGDRHDRRTLILIKSAALAQGFLSIAFSAFWSTLAVMLLERYHLGSAVAGGFGIAGAAGKLGAGKVTQLGAVLVTVSFALMFLMPALGVHGQLMLIAISAVGFDLGLQSSLVAHQNLVYSLEPQARGRLNALLFTVVFIGMALGSALGSNIYSLAGWTGVVALATICGVIALVIRLIESARVASVTAEVA